LNGELVPEEPAGGIKPRKPRLDRFGRPWRSRKKKRTSDDLKRDKMVETVLAESPCKFLGLLFKS
jgi:hypothetical protein